MPTCPCLAQTSKLVPVQLSKERVGGRDGTDNSSVRVQLNTENVRDMHAVGGRGGTDNSSVRVHVQLNTENVRDMQ